MYALFTKGYQADTVQYDKGFVDYVFPNILGYSQDSIQEDTERIDYLVGYTGLYSNVIIEQATGWDVNWELINMPWDTINNNWE